MTSILGHHHVSMYTKDASETNRFYKKVLGLRRVKVSVNQENPTMYHLFYGDTVGSPGTELTFFEMPKVGSTHKGTNAYSRIGLLVPTIDSLHYWKNRLDEYHIKHGQLTRYAGRDALHFEDLEGLSFVLQVSNGDQLPFWKPWKKSPVPAEHQILGLGTMELTVSDLKRMTQTLVNVFNFKVRNQTSEEVLCQSIEGDVFGEILLKKQDGPSIRLGRGSVHHLAFRVQSDDDLMYFEQKLIDYGLTTTGIVDRYYFKSLYYTDPSGIVFEVATDGPGFTIDSTIEELGKGLDLPPSLENKREDIESRLRPIVE